MKRNYLINTTSCILGVVMAMATFISCGDREQEVVFTQEYKASVNDYASDADIFSMKVPMFEIWGSG